MWIVKKGIDRAAIIKKMKYNAITQIGLGIIRLFIPFCFYLRHSIGNPKIITFILPWLSSNLDPKGRSATKDATPWITFEAKAWIEAFLVQNHGKQMTVFEFGSGGSTIFFTKRFFKVISVEHNHEWYSVVCKILQRENISNCKYLLREPQPFSGKNPSDPRSYGSHEYDNMSFEAYVKSIDEYPNKSFDLVFIDGRARPSCILHARNKVKHGGIIILDNSERDYYLLGKELLSDWGRIDFYGPGPYGRYFWQTSIWKRPPNLEQAPLLPTEYHDFVR